MNSQSIWLALGVAVILGLAILLLGGSQSPADSVGVAAQTATTSGSATGGSSAVRLGAAAPIVEVGEDRIVGERETIRLSATAYDPEGGAVSVVWSVEGGLGFFSDPYSPSTSFTAPSACDCDTRVTLTLTATNRAGIIARDRLIIEVRDPATCSTRTYETSGAWISVPTDPCRVDEDASCPVQPDEACTSPCVTDATGEICYEVPSPCPCDGDCGPVWGAGWPQDPQASPMQAKDRPKPLIDRQYPERIAERAVISLHGSIKNPACQSVCFVWTASKGWFEAADTLDPIYHAPESERDGGERVTITLVAYDQSGGRSYDQIRIQIDNLDYKTPSV